MKLDAKVKGGLAWAGLVVILAVPAADLIFGKPGDAAATAITSDSAAAKAAGPVAAVKPVAKPTLVVPGAKTDPVQTASIGGKDPVDSYVQSGKKLPSYISDGGGQAAAPPPAAVKPPAGTTSSTGVAAAAPVKATPPLPLPRSARPAATAVAALPAEEKPLIIDETRVGPRAPAPVKPFPLSDGGKVVTGDQLEEWDSGSLADYLARKGLLSDSRAEVEPADDYDADGFYLDEGPNSGPPPRRLVRREPDFFLF